jgi:hypothetical protein
MVMKVSWRAKHTVKIKYNNYEIRKLRSSKYLGTKTVTNERVQGGGGRQKNHTYQGYILEIGQTTDTKMCFGSDVFAPWILVIKISSLRTD